MFRDIKEYQELQKLYEDKVSTSKNIDEGLGQFIDKLRGISPKDREDINKEKMVIKSLKDSDKFKEVKKDGKKVIQSTTNNNTEPKLTDQDKSDIKKEKDAEKLNQSIKSGEFKKIEQKVDDAKKKVEVQKVKTNMSGAERAKMLARKRIGSGTARNPDTTIAQANQRNRDAMRDRARERNTAFQKRREEFRQNRKAGISNSRPQPKVVSPMDTRNDSFIPDGETIEERLGGRGVSKKAAAGSIYPGNKGDGQTEDQDRGAGNKAKKRAGETVEKKSPTFIAYIKNKKEDKKEDKKDDNKMEAYDVVLEYLLSTQQAATIEEANYIMTEMDAKTIQDIVSQQLNEQN